MARFRYKAIDRNGVRHTGDIDAATIVQAQALLTEQSLVPVWVRAHSNDSQRQRRAISRGLANTQFVDVLEDLAALLIAGVPLAHALEVLSTASGQTLVRTSIEQASHRLRAGGDLATTLASVGDGGAFLEGLVRVGQLSGDLGLALRHAAAVLRRDEQIRTELWSALAYPGFVLVALLVGIVVILGFVAPALAPLVAELEPGQGIFLHALVTTSDAFRALAMPLAVVFSAVAFVLVVLGVRGRLQSALALVFANGPIRRTIAELEFGAWAAGAGRLIIAGAPVPQAALGACAFVQNEPLRNQLLKISNRMRDGLSLARVLVELPATPPAIERMARIGELAGGLGHMLERAGEQAQSRAVRRIRRAAAIAAPLALLVMGTLIGAIIAGLLSGVAAIGDAALQ